MNSLAQGRYAHIDGMRALAVMLVVVAHAGWGNVVPGGSGVTIFFSISGFIITFLLLREKDVSGTFKMRAFYARRARKIGPPLVVCVILPTLVLALFRPIDWSPLIGIVFFYYNWFKAFGAADAPLPGSGVVWSLSIEEQFYIAFAIIWLAIVKWGTHIRWLVAIAWVFAVSSLLTRMILASIASLDTDRIYYGSDTRIDGLAIGVLSAIALHRARQRDGRNSCLVHMCTKDQALIAAVLLYITSLAIRDDWFRDTFRFTFQSLAACVVILYGFGEGNSRLRTAFNRLSRNRLVQIIGLSSYSIYLVHLTTMFYVSDLTNELPGVAQVLVLTVAGTGAGILVYRCVEIPVQRAKASTKVPRVDASEDPA